MQHAACCQNAESEDETLGELLEIVRAAVDS
jgi:hypothetical protein